MRRFGWLRTTGQRWLALISLPFTVATIVGFAITEHRVWAWLAIGGLFALVVALGWTAHDAHNAPLRERAADPRGEAERLLVALAARFDHATSRDWKKSPAYYHETTEKLSTEIYEALDRFYGPAVADDFSSSGWTPPPTAPDSVATQQAAYLRGLLGRLDSLPIMGDWDQR